MASPNPPLEPPKESVARGYKFAWRILLISNLALGAYIFSRPRKNDTGKRDKKATAKVPIVPLEYSISSVSEEASISDPMIDSANKNDPVPENQWAKVFKW